MSREITKVNDPEYGECYFSYEKDSNGLEIKSWTKINDANSDTLVKVIKNGSCINRLECEHTPITKESGAGCLFDHDFEEELHTCNGKFYRSGGLPASKLTIQFKYHKIIKEVWYDTLSEKPNRNDCNPVEVKTDLYDLSILPQYDYEKIVNKFWYGCSINDACTVPVKWEVENYNDGVLVEAYPINAGHSEYTCDTYKIVKQLN
jgi:hypothetical protein